MQQNLTRNQKRGFVDKKLRNRLGLYLFISVVIFGVVVYQITQNNIGISLPLLGLIVGVFIGILFSRTYKIYWDHDGQQVVSRMDSYGIALLVLYILFEIFRERIVGIFVPGPALFGVSFAVLAGVMYGRVLGMRGKIGRIIKEQI
jgi:hypothetical protein